MGSASCPPCYMNLVCPESNLHESDIFYEIHGLGEPLRASALFERCVETHTETQKPGLSDHNPVVDAEPETGILLSGWAPWLKHVPFICRKYLSAAFLRHDTHHLL